MSDVGAARLSLSAACVQIIRSVWNDDDGNGVGRSDGDAILQCRQRLRCQTCMHDGDRLVVRSMEARQSTAPLATRVTFVAISGSSTPPTDFTGGSTFSTSTRSKRGISLFAITLGTGCPDCYFTALMTRCCVQQETCSSRERVCKSGAKRRKRCQARRCLLLGSETTKLAGGSRCLLLRGSKLEEAVSRHCLERGRSGALAPAIRCTGDRGLLCHRPRRRP